MQALAPDSKIDGYLASLRTEHLLSALALLEAIPDGPSFVKVGFGRFRKAGAEVDRETGEVTKIYEVEARWGRMLYSVPLTAGAAVAYLKNWASICSRSAGRGQRYAFRLVPGGR